MADKKKGRQRPDKYAEKVKLNTSLEETLKIFADVANKKTRTALEEKVDKLNADKSDC